MEIYTNEKDADKIISVSKSFGIDAKIIGRVETAATKSLLLITAGKEISFE
jgi:phosphoribosylformylglycinamidine cyclo-ligase